MSIRPYILAASLIFLSACGGGGSDPAPATDNSSSPGPQLLVGRFIDAAVDGLQVRQDGEITLTAADGSFNYLPNEPLNFLLGDILVGRSVGADVITPVQLVPGATGEDLFADPPAVLNIVRVMLTLDVNADPSDGIQVSQQARDAGLGRSLNFAQTFANFGNDAAVLTYIDAATSDQTAARLAARSARSLVSAEDAASHFRATLDALADDDGNGGGNSGGNNIAPIVSAGDDQEVLAGANVVLTAEASDSDGEVTRFAWIETTGTGVVLQGADTNTASFTAPLVDPNTELTFEITVTDDDGATATDRVAVLVSALQTNQPPVANAGADLAVPEQSTVTLDASSSRDDDGQIAQFSWEELSTSAVEISNADSEQASFVAPTVTQITTLNFRLTVVDDDGASAEDVVEVQVTPVNLAPVANPGEPQEAGALRTVTLNGESSDDSDGSIEAFAWVSLDAEVELIDANTAVASFVAPDVVELSELRFSLQVTDNEEGTDTAVTTVTVLPNQAPIANAGADQSDDEGSLFQLSANESTDADDAIVAFAWSQVGGSAVELAAADTATPSFVGPAVDADETLRFEVTVTDERGKSDSDVVDVTVFDIPVGKLRVGAAKLSVTPSQEHIDGVVESRAFIGQRLQKFNLGGFGLNPTQNFPDPFGALGVDPTQNLPEPFTPLGQPLTQPAEERFHEGPHGPEDTWIRAVALEQINDDESVTQVLFIVLDAIGAGNVIQNNLRAAVVEVTGIESDNILFGQTHTHAGADLQGLWGGVPQDWIENTLYTAAAEAAKQAFESLEPAQLEVGRGDLSEWNRYRRPKRIDEEIDSDTLGSLMKARSTRTGEVIASLMQFVAHPVSINEDPRVPHPDYILGAVDYLEDIYAGSTALYFNGPIADASASGPTSGDTPYDRVRSRGAGMATDADGFAIDRVLESGLSVRHETVILPVTNPAFIALGVAGTFNRYYDFVDLPASQIPGIGPTVATGLTELPQLTPTATTLVSRVTIGDGDANLELVTMPGEATGTFGEFIRSLARPQDHVMLLGLTQNSFGYIIPEEEFSYFDASGDAGLEVPFTGYEELVSLGPLTAPLLRAQGYLPLFDAENSEQVPPYLQACEDNPAGEACIFHIAGARLEYIQSQFARQCREAGLPAFSPEQIPRAFRDFVFGEDGEREIPLSEAQAAYDEWRQQFEDQKSPFCDLIDPQTPLAGPCRDAGFPEGVCGLLGDDANGGGNGGGFSQADCEEQGAAINEQGAEAFCEALFSQSPPDVQGFFADVQDCSFNESGPNCAFGAGFDNLGGESLGLLLASIVDQCDASGSDFCAAINDAIPDELIALSRPLDRGVMNVVEAAPLQPSEKVVDGDLSDWQSQSSGIGGSAQFHAGEHIYTDYIFDAYGADDGDDARRLALLGPVIEFNDRARRIDQLEQAVGDQLGVPDPIGAQDRYGDRGLADGNDLHSLRWAAQGNRLYLAATLVNLNSADQADLLVLLDTGAGPDQPADIGFGLSTSQYDLAIRLNTEGVTAWNIADSTAVEVGAEVAVDANNNGLEVGFDAAALTNEAGALNVTVLSVNGDDSIANVGYRFSEPVAGVYNEQRQALALFNGNVDGFSHQISVADLLTGRTQSSAPGAGYHERQFISADNISTESGESGRIQHYGLYVPTSYDGSQATPISYWLHYRGGKAHSGAAWTPRLVRQLGEDLGNIVATPRGRGTSSWYTTDAHQDVFEVIMDAEAIDVSDRAPTVNAGLGLANALDLNIDHSRRYLSGYSMGGYGTYLFGLLYPDFFAAGYSTAGATTQGAWTGVDPDQPLCDTSNFEADGDNASPCFVEANDGDANAQLNFRLLENARHFPLSIHHGTNDELVPLPGVERMADRLVELGYRSDYLRFPGYEHFTQAAVDEWTEGARYMQRFSINDNPRQVTYKVVPALVDAVNTVKPDPRNATFDYQPDGAYWVDDLVVRGVNPEQPRDASISGMIEAVSSALPGETQALVPQTGIWPDAPAPSSPIAAPGHSTPFIRSGLEWIATGDAPIANAFSTTLTGLVAARLDTARMQLNPALQIDGQVQSDGVTDLVLGNVSSPVDVWVDGALLLTGVSGEVRISLTSSTRLIQLVPTGAVPVPPQSNPLVACGNDPSDPACPLKPLADLVGPGLSACMADPTADTCPIAAFVGEAIGNNPGLLACGASLIASGCPLAEMVSAIREQFTDAPLVCTADQSGSFEHLMGAMHEHSGYSDGTPGTEPRDYFAAGSAAGLAYMASADHSDNLAIPVTANSDCASPDFPDCFGAGNENPEDGIRNWDATAEQAAAASHENFIAIRGFEWTSDRFGHISVYDSANYLNAKTSTGYALSMEDFWQWFTLPAEASFPGGHGFGNDGLGVFNHPGREDDVHQLLADPAYAFNGFVNVPGANHRMIGIEVFGKSSYYDADGPNGSWYAHALDQGWHVGPISGEDHHGTDWAQPDLPKTVVIAREHSREAIREAWLARRFYAVAQDYNAVRLAFTGDDTAMGARLAYSTATTVSFNASVSLPGNGAFAPKFEVVGPGGEILETGEGASISFVAIAAGEDESYRFVRVIDQANGRVVAVSAPIWFRVGEAYDICPNPTPVDSDADGVPDSEDAFPNDPSESADADGDGVGDNADTDDDNDGREDADDLCPATPPGEVADAEGCSASQRDSDGDEVSDADDLCPDTASGSATNDDGCSADQLQNASCATGLNTGGGRSYQVVLPSDVDGNISFQVLEPSDFDCGTVGAHPLVLHGHGFGGSRATRDFEHYQNPGFTVISIDQRGFGASTGPITVMDPDAEGRDLVKILDWAEQNLDYLSWRDKATGEYVERPADATSRVDGPNLVVGASGDSYGGGFQLLILGVDPKQRLDALAPDITWHDLRYSLNPGDVVKTLWDLALVGLGESASVGNGLLNFESPTRRGLSPFIKETLVRGGSTNEFPRQALDDFRYNSLSYWCEAAGLPTMPYVPYGEDAVPMQNASNAPANFPADYVLQGDIAVLLTQGLPDTLFNFNEAWWNMQCLQAAGADVQLYTHTGGHALQYAQAPEGPDTPVGGAGCSVNEADWMSAQLLPEGGDNPASHEVCFVLDGGDLAFIDRFDVLAPQPGLNDNERGAFTRVGIPLNAVPNGYFAQIQADGVLPVPVELGTAEAELILAGIGHLDIEVSTPAGVNELAQDCSDAAVPVTRSGCDSITFIGLGRKAAGTFNYELIDDQIQPVRGLGQHSVDLVGVAERLEAGDSLALLLFGAHSQYPFSFSRDATIPAVSVTGTVDLPLYATDENGQVLAGAPVAFAAVNSAAGPEQQIIEALKAQCDRNGRANAACEFLQNAGRSYQQEAAYVLAAFDEYCRIGSPDPVFCERFQELRDPVEAGVDNTIGEPEATGQARAGAAIVDATWHFGASAGQFSATGHGIDQGRGYDPYNHATRKVGSDTLADRITTRALVVDGANGNRVAVIANDLYLPNDLMRRRVIQLLQEHDAQMLLNGGEALGIGEANLAMTVSHSHASPFYSTPAPGPWIFQDVFDLRFYEYMAEKMRDAIVAAAADQRAVTMGGSAVYANDVRGHTYGAKVSRETSTENTPAGQPHDYTTRQMYVLRFDDADSGENYANWVVLGIHPEWVWGEEVISGDLTHATMRLLDRETGAINIMSQSETGASGPHKGERAHDGSERHEYQESAFAGAHRAARKAADNVHGALDDITNAQPWDENQYAAISGAFSVGYAHQRFAPPGLRPLPGLSNCNMDTLYHEADPTVNAAELPECERVSDQTSPVGDGLDAAEGTFVEPFEAMFGNVLPNLPETYDSVNEAIRGVAAPMISRVATQLQEFGVPLPHSYSAYTVAALEEQATVPIQAFKLGDVAVTFCPCEQFSDPALNVISRLNKVAGDFHTGWDWDLGYAADNPLRDPANNGDFVHDANEVGCSVNGDSVTCPHPSRGDTGLLTMTLEAFQRMKAQIHNDARGWEDAINGLHAEAEAKAIADIWGNFTHEEHTQHGYGLVIPVGMANDYWGYMPAYREYRAHDHYRKSLAGLGPHGADFLATRMSRVAAQLNGGAGMPYAAKDIAYLVESGRAESFAAAVGTTARGFVAAYDASIPGDGGEPAIITQPENIERFDGATVQWIGGSSYLGMPEVVIQRCLTETCDAEDDSHWQTVGDQTGEVVLHVDFLRAATDQTGPLVLPHPEDLATWRAGEFEWVWTAGYEAYASEVPVTDAQDVTRPQAAYATPVGTYRFVIEGQHQPRQGLPPASYQFNSGSFDVAAWSGIDVDADSIVSNAGQVSFGLGPSTIHTTFQNGADTRRDRDHAPRVVGPIDYPDTWDDLLTGGEPLIPWLRNERNLYFYSNGQEEQYCHRCTFRPWIDAGVAESVTVTVELLGEASSVEASSSDGVNWRAEVVGESAYIAPGGIVDQFGNTNGQCINLVGESCP